MRGPVFIHSSAFTLRLGALLALPALGACMGAVGTPAAGGSGSGSSNGGTGGNVGIGGAGAPLPDPLGDACARSGGGLNVGITKLRRLTRDQLDNTVRDLLNVTSRPAEALAPDERVGPFHSNAVAPITELLVEQHHEMAAALATGAQSRMSQISPCDLAAETGTTTTCATRFITEFGRRAYRRPLEPAEISKLVSLYALGKAGTGGVQNGFRLVLETMLQSPFFLYHHDVGPTGTPQASPVGITPWELASRLSYFLWNSMPDTALFDAAANGSLTDDGIIAAQVERMLASDKAAATIALFHRQWLALEELPAREKDAAVYPLYSAAVADAMMQETALFTDYVIRRGDGLLRTLLTSNMAFPHGGLFQVYGVSQPAGYTVGTPVMLDATRRAGLLTQAAFLTRHGHRDQSAPVQRGIIVREHIMCQIIPSPPANANTNPPPRTATTSTRQRFAQHVADKACADCHVLMDPIGLGFENYDAIGAYRTDDGMTAVDASGQILGGGPDLDGTFDGAVELANKLAGARVVSDCMASQWFRFSLGRMESTNDACSVVAIRDGFRASSGNVRTLLAQIALSPAFRNVRAVGN
jgi:hypothetical protein